MSHLKKVMARRMKKGGEAVTARRTLGPNPGFKGTENMNQMGGNTGAKPKK